MFFKYSLCIVAVSCFLCYGLPLFADDASAPYWYGTGERMFMENSFMGSRNVFEKSLSSENSLPLLSSHAEFRMLRSAYENGDADAVLLLEEYINTSIEREGIPSAKSMLADLYMRSGRRDDAEKVYASVDVNTLSGDERNLMTLNCAVIEYEKGNYGRVKELLAGFSDKDSERADKALYYRSAACYALNEYDEAEAGFGRLSQTEGFADAARYYLAGIYFADKRFKAALETGESVLASSPADGPERREVLRICGESSFYLGNREGCISFLEDYVDGNPAPVPEALYMLGVSCYYAGRYADAVAFLGEVAGDDMELMQSASLYLGHSYLASGDKDGALLAYGNAVDNGNDAAVRETALYNYALLLNETGIVSFSKGVGAFEKYLNMFPDSKNAATVKTLLVNRYFTAGDYGEALASIANIENPDAVILKAKQEILYRMGSQLYIDGDMVGARAAFSQAVDLGPLSADVFGKALLWRGEIDYAKRDYASASADFSKALQYPSTLPAVYYNLGYVEFSTGAYARAEEWFGKFVSYAGSRAEVVADAWYRMGDCRYMASDYAGAASAYAKGGDLWPAGADYSLFRQGVVARVRKQTGDMVAFMVRLREEFPSSPYLPDAMLLEGTGLVALGKSAEGIKVLSGLVSKYPSSDAARSASLQRAVAYVNSGDMSRAVEAYRQVVVMYPGSGEARIAEADLKNLYVQSGNIDDYMKFLNEYRAGNGYDVAEIDSLTFLAAENLFLKSPAEGFARMEGYLKSYPDGAFAADAAYYAGSYMFDKGDIARCRAFLTKGVAGRAGGRFAAETLYLLASVEEKSGNNVAAEGYYRKISESYPGWAGVTDARRGLVRTSYAAGEYDVAVSEASLLLNSSLSDKEIPQILYLRAFAYLKLGEKEAARADLVRLAADKRNVYGAEAAFRLGEMCFDNNHLDGAEAYASGLVSSGTGQRYWVARAIILLSDVSYKKGDRFKAVQYLKSLAGNYAENDDIKEIIERKLVLYAD